MNALPAGGEAAVDGIENSQNRFKLRKTLQVGSNLKNQSRNQASPT
jgi:hypothetical protein